MAQINFQSQSMEKDCLNIKNMEDRETKKKKGEKKGGKKRKKKEP